MSLTRSAQESLDKYREDVALAFEGRQHTNAEQDRAACRLAESEEVIAFHHSRLAKFKCPPQVRFVGSLPRRPIAKILRKDLRGQV